MNYFYGINYLDQLKKQHGVQNLHSAFDTLCKNNPKNALRMLGSADLSFSTFFLLLPEVEHYRLYEGLNERGRIARTFSRNEKIYPKGKSLPLVLKWMLLTGAMDDEQGDDFDEVLDRAASQMLLEYKDHTLLPVVTELLFRRGRKEKHIHDLSWCLFKTQNAAVMPLVAEYLRSDQDCDRQLAHKLLNFKPELQPDDKGLQYQNFITWFEENKKFLYFAEQSMQQTSNPKHWRTNLPAKYLCTPIDTLAIKASTAQEKEQLLRFETLEEPEQKLLAKHSFQLHHNDMAVWNNFMKLPIEHQLAVAKDSLGGAL